MPPSFLFPILLPAHTAMSKFRKNGKLSWGVSYLSPSHFPPSFLYQSVFHKAPLIKKMKQSLGYQPAAGSTPSVAVSAHCLLWVPHKEALRKDSQQRVWRQSQETPVSRSPQPFCHQGLVSWKTICPQTRGGGWFLDDLSALHSSSAAAVWPSF